MSGFAISEQSAKLAACVGYDASSRHAVSAAQLQAKSACCNRRPVRVATGGGRQFLTCVPLLVVIEMKNQSQL